VKYKDFAVELAKEAGKIIKSNFTIGMEKGWKGIDGPVTKTDKGVNSLVIESVKKYFPDHNIRGEEESYHEQKSEFLWVCDPIDGTIPFSHGLPVFMFSLALVKNGEPIMGVLYDPILDKLFYAEKGHGATLDGKAIKVSDRETLKDSAVDIESWSTARYYAPALEREVYSTDALLVHYACITYPCALVAAGEFVGAIFAGYTEWDIAAVKVIVEEAGGKVTDLFGQEQRYDQDIKGAVISNGKTHDILLKIVKEAIAKNE
jgi:myo-inositol-1(or 4)-monophosphatase